MAYKNKSPILSLWGWKIYSILNVTGPYLLFVIILVNFYIYIYFVLKVISSDEWVVGNP